VSSIPAEEPTPQSEKSARTSAGQAATPTSTTTTGERAAANDPPPPKSAADTTAPEPPPTADAHEDAARAAGHTLRDLLTRGVVITGDLLQETVDEAVRRGRLTRRDAEDLVQNLLQISRRQTQDMLAELEALVERSTAETRRLTNDRVKSVAAAARRAPGADRALRTVDRARRVAGVGPAFPIMRYDELTAAQVNDRLGDLSPPELRKVRDHERRNANRKSVLAAIEKQLA
jgi:polyhydroxyalkanoate synthesis regulator phasin